MSKLRLLTNTGGKRTLTKMRNNRRSSLPGMRDRGGHYLKDPNLTSVNFLLNVEKRAR